ncbi:MAG: hypothetical protein OEN20_08600 [Gammaproteobacteria bacterium]|nr:hypothetical protein [Gammaproteobacteria bacterium]
MPRTDIDNVLAAAAALDIAEVQLFREAYRKWFGDRIGEETLDRYFVAYMFAGVVPHWVRDYARQVLDNAARHRLDPVKFGVFPVLRRRPRFGLGMVLLQFAVLMLLVLIADWTLHQLPDYQGCLLPPCY